MKEYIYNLLISENEIVCFCGVLLTTLYFAVPALGLLGVSAVCVKIWEKISDFFA